MHHDGDDDYDDDRENNRAFESWPDRRARADLPLKGLILHPKRVFEARIIMVTLFIYLFTMPTKWKQENLILWLGSLWRQFCLSN